MIIIKKLNKKEVQVKKEKMKKKKLKMYEVSIVCSGIEAESEKGAISQFEELVETGYFGRDSYEVELDRGNI